MNNTLSTKKTLPAAIVAVVVLALPFILQVIAGNDYAVMICCIILVYVIAVSGLDILFGYSGQISLGHAAFFVIGAYTSGLLNNYFNTPLWLTIPAGALLATGIGALLAWPASKLEFHFLSLATIAFGEIVYQLVAQSPGQITGNFLGFFTDPVNLFGFEFDSNMSFYYFG